LTLYPALALVSMNMTLSSLALASPSSIETCLEDDKAEMDASLPLVGKVGLVAHQHDNHIVSALRSNIVDPLGGLLERVSVYIQ
jgi:hypothetical protein